MVKRLQLATSYIAFNETMLIHTTGYDKTLTMIQIRTGQVLGRLHQEPDMNYQAFTLSRTHLFLMPTDTQIAIHRLSTLDQIAEFEVTGDPEQSENYAHSGQFPALTEDGSILLWGEDQDYDDPNRDHFDTYDCDEIALRSVFVHDPREGVVRRVGMPKFGTGVFLVGREIQCQGGRWMRVGSRWYLKELVMCDDDEVELEEEKWRLGDCLGIDYEVEEVNVAGS
ncbi:hypothetical protein HK097_010207 [Rhizophlyctis rosea]|uniref:Uncharacterized protein n=1 Tax=Rhizophlyctis rosea TaxID=64517 RepID=A0AAD5SB48_9FUNG|nr:hypothetical protein HK097_010207 [Rhizophlyctis rosea]